MSEKIYNTGQELENRSFKMVRKLINRLLMGFFHFKTRKGDLVAGSVTFFSLLSFAPMLLAMITLSAWLIGDNELAKVEVINFVKDNIPKVAPWIVKSIEQIVNDQLTKGSSQGLTGYLILFYSLSGVIASILFGLNILKGTRSKGGFLIEDIKSIFVCFIACCFMATIIVLSSPTLMKAIFSFDKGKSELVGLLLSYQILPATVAFSFISIFYYLSGPKGVALKDACLGGATFVASFLIGKSFYWVYHLYTKDTLSASFGAFYTLVLAAFWVYYLNCSFFYGASVSFCIHLRDKRRTVEVPPAILKDQEKIELKSSDKKSA